MLMRSFDDFDFDSKVHFLISRPSAGDCLEVRSLRLFPANSKIKTMKKEKKKRTKERKEIEKKRERKKKRKKRQKKEKKVRK